MLALAADKISTLWSKEQKSNTLILVINGSIETCSGSALGKATALEAPLFPGLSSLPHSSACSPRPIAQPRGHRRWLPLPGCRSSSSSGSSLEQGSWLSLCAVLIPTGLETAPSHCQSGSQCQMLRRGLEPGPWGDGSSTTLESCWQLEKQLATRRQLRWLNLSQHGQARRCLPAAGWVTSDAAAGGTWQCCQLGARSAVEGRTAASDTTVPLVPLQARERSRGWWRRGEIGPLQLSGFRAKCLIQKEIPVAGKWSHCSEDLAGLLFGAAPLSFYKIVWLAVPAAGVGSALVPPASCTGELGLRCLVLLWGRDTL